MNMMEFVGAKVHPATARVEGQMGKFSVIDLLFYDKDTPVHAYVACRPNLTDQIVKALQRLVPVAVPKEETQPEAAAAEPTQDQIETALEDGQITKEDAEKAEAEIQSQDAHTSSEAEPA